MCQRLLPRHTDIPEDYSVILSETQDRNLLRGWGLEEKEEKSKKGCGVRRVYRDYAWIPHDGL